MVQDPRTLHANERTLLAWLRTGVSLLTFGFFIAKLGLWLRTQPGAPTTAPRSALVGSVLVFLGAVTEIVGTVRYVRVRRALLAQQPVPIGASDVVGIAVAVALVGIYLSAHLIYSAYRDHVGG
jgi:putative membrane protein